MSTNAETDVQGEWRDVFITRDSRDSNGNEYVQDDEYVGAFCSVDFVGSGVAKIVDDDTDIIMPFFVKDYSGSAPLHKRLLNAKAGDLIRIGSPRSGGYTDWLTILEVFTLTSVKNGTSQTLKLKSDQATTTGDTIGAAGATTAPTDTLILNFPFYCFRVNQVLNITELADTTLTAANRIAPVAAYRYGSYTNDSSRLKDNFYYPAYMPIEYTSPLVAQLGVSVKQVREIRLVGYSFVSKRNVGIQSGNEIVTDDFVILRLRNIMGTVISNNEHAHTSFAVLHAGHSHDILRGAVEYHMYDPLGLACQRITPSQRVSELSIQVLDRAGKPAQIGRLHLWFRIRCA